MSESTIRNVGRRVNAYKSPGYKLEKESWMVYNGLIREELSYHSELGFYANVESKSGYVHSAAASFEMAKKCSKDFRTALRTPSSRALK